MAFIQRNALWQVLHKIFLTFPIPYLITLTPAPSVFVNPSCAPLSLFVPPPPFSFISQALFLFPICASFFPFSERIGTSKSCHPLFSAAIFPPPDNPWIQAGRHSQKDPFLITRRPLPTSASEISARLPAIRSCPVRPKVGGARYPMPSVS